jgi:hypothetical protein
MPVRDPAGAAVLERRYLRLLRCYPPTHREFHREEMLGVLLAAARPGQRTPGKRGGLAADFLIAYWVGRLV